MASATATLEANVSDITLEKGTTGSWPRHRGDPPREDTTLCAEPPTGVGEVLSADGRTRNQRVCPLSLRLLAASVAPATCVAAIWWYLRWESPNDDNLPLALLVGLIFGSPLAILAWRATATFPFVTYVGTEGVARICVSSSGEEVRTELFSFANAEYLYLDVRKRKVKNIPTGHQFEFRWEDSMGDVAFRLRGIAQRVHAGRPESPWWFARAAEKAWTAFLLKRQSEQADDQGGLQFSTRRGWIRVSDGHLEWSKDGAQTERYPSAELCPLVIQDGCLAIRSREAGLLSSRGRLSVKIKKLANFEMFLLCARGIGGAAVTGKLDAPSAP